MTEFIHNLDWNEDLLPRPSTLYTVPTEVSRFLKAVDPDLSIGWVSACEECEFERPGDMNRCHSTMIEVEPDYWVRAGCGSKRIGGYWALYIQRLMFQRFPWRGATLTVQERLPWVAGWFNPMGMLVPSHLATVHITRMEERPHAAMRRLYNRLLTEQNLQQASRRDDHHHAAGQVLTQFRKQLEGPTGYSAGATVTVQ